MPSSTNATADTYAMCVPKLVAPVAPAQGEPEVLLLAIGDCGRCLIDATICPGTSESS
jgi:hypothetical protein